MKRFKHTLIALGVMLAGVLGASKAYAQLEYSEDLDVQFTFNPTMSVEISDDVVSANIAPGTTGTGENITITVNTNSSAGYTLSASAGNGTGTYTDTALHGATSSFTSIATNTAVTAFASAETWGITTDSGTHFIGLPYNTTTSVLNKTTDASGTAAASGCAISCNGTSATTFAIGAKTSNSQAAGDYSNVINFTIVSNIAG